MDFRIVPSTAGKNVVMRGRFTFADHEQFAIILKDIQTKQSDSFCFDFEGVEFIDSAAIGLMLIAREKAEKSGVRIAIRGATGKVQTIFKMARFDQMFEMASA